MNRYHRIAIQSLLLVSLLLVATATVSAVAQGVLPPDSILVRSLTFRSIGPGVMSGRIVDIAVPEHPGTKGNRMGTIIYAAAATGGVWKSVNGGQTFTPVFDSVRTGSVGAVATAPSNPDIVWVGTGEPQNMRSSSWGTGVYKSTDGGKTWSGAMLPKSQHIGRIVIDPRNPDVVYVAALGPLWASGGERGLFKTTDGGKTWTNTKPISQYTGFTELVMDPSNPDVLYAASLERERREYGFLPGGPESAIYKTVDAGKTWTQLTSGLPTGELGRIGLSVCRSKPATVYAVIHAKGNTGGVFRSDDAGATWRGGLNASNSTAWYYSQVRCDPTDPEHVVRLLASAQESSDGGKTWTGYPQAGGTHGDHHALWINPENPDQHILGNDGGLYLSFDAGRSWDHKENIIVGQFYAIGLDDAQPFYNVYGGLQDNSTYGGPTRTRNSFGPTNADWYRQAGGDGFYDVPDPNDRNLVYAESQQGGLVRYDVRTGQTKNIRPNPKPGERYRFNWSTPIVPSKHTVGTVYFAAQYLFVSPDRGDSWQAISPDLTRNIDRDKLPLRGAVPDSGALGRNEGTAAFSNITSVDESSFRPGLLVVGTDDGLIQVTKDGGKTWTKSDKFAGVPETTFVSRVIWSKANEGTIYATFDGHRSNDFKPYVFKSTNYGASWTAITGDLPDGGSVWVIREHFRQPNLLFVGTEFGAFFSIEGGNHWTQLKGGLPGVPVEDLQIQPRWNDLVAGTHGRGIYVLDDIAPLEKLAQAKQAANAYLFPVVDQMLLSPNGSRSSGMTSSGFVAQNPPPGPRVAYLVRNIPADAKAKIEIVDATGAVVREIAMNKQPGLYRTTWDMCVGPPLTGPVTVPDTAAQTGRGFGGGGGGRGGAGCVGAGGGGFGGGGRGRGAATGDIAFQTAPGAYKARLTVTPASGSPTVQEQPFALAKDGMVALAEADLKALYSFRLGVAKLQQNVRARVAQLDTVQRRLADVKRVVDSAANAPATAKTELAAIETELSQVAQQLGAPQPGGRGGRGGRGGGGRGGAGGAGGEAAPPVEELDPAAVVAQAQTVTNRLGTLNETLTGTFNPTPEQKSTALALPAEVQKQADRVANVMAVRLPALIKALKDAGVQVGG